MVASKRENPVIRSLIIRQEIPEILSRTTDDTIWNTAKQVQTETSKGERGRERGRERGGETHTHLPGKGTDINL